MIAFILNLPFSIIGLLIAIVSRPRLIRINKSPIAIVLDTRSWWWTIGYLKGIRAATIGHVVLLGKNCEPGDLEHELIHVTQYSRIPLIHPILYTLETIRHGYRNNKYEIEAYRVAGNIYKE